MAVFEYTALDARGQQRKGFTESESERQARRQLREQGLIPLDLRGGRPERRAAGEASPPPAASRAGLSGEQLALFTRLLGSLLASGLPLDDALTAIANQSEDRRLRRVVLGVRDQILEGQSLEYALRRYPAAFPGAYAATVGAGEQTRHLPLVLGRLAEFVEQQQGLRQRLRVAMIYPVVLLLTAAAVVSLLMAFVVPEVVRVFEHGEQTLPGITRALIAFSDHFPVIGAAVITLVLVAGVALRRAMAVPAMRLRIDAALLRVPVLGRLIRETNAARFARTLGILLDSGVELIQGLEISARALGSEPMRQRVVDSVRLVREGESLGRALAGGGQMPALLLHLVRAGENSGELPQMLTTAARTHEQNAASGIAVLMGLLEPVLILSMGAIILVVVLAVLLPIFDLNQLV